MLQQDNNLCFHTLETNKKQHGEINIKYIQYIILLMIFGPWYSFFLKPSN